MSTPLRNQYSARLQAQQPSPICESQTIAGAGNVWAAILDDLWAPAKLGRISGIGDACNDSAGTVKTYARSSCSVLQYADHRLKIIARMMNYRTDSLLSAPPLK